MRVEPASCAIAAMGHAVHRLESAEQPGMRILITGAGGFVAPYVVDTLRASISEPNKIILSGRCAPGDQARGIVPLDIIDTAAVERTISETRPTHVIHLAAVSSPVNANSDPDLTWRVNVGGTLAIARAILKSAPDCVLLFVSSGHVYGETASLNRALTEVDVLAPLGDYAATKACADIALGALVGKGLRCIRLRPFNHSGRGQTEDFALPGFAAQIARIEAGLAPPVIKVGDLEAERDFLDVRDVADAYCRAVLRAAEMRPGTIFNISSGIPRSVGGLLRRLLAMSDTKIEIEQDPARMRPSDTPRFFGDATRARQLLDWAPRHTIDDLLSDVLSAAREKLAQP